jgi:hypothetical protein
MRAIKNDSELVARHVLVEAGVIVRRHYAKGRVCTRALLEHPKIGKLWAVEKFRNMGIQLLGFIDAAIDGFYACLSTRTREGISASELS